MEEFKVQNGAENHVGGEPIAVIGFGLKFPQKASSPAAFWDLLIHGGSARSEVPADRYNADAFHRVGGNKVKTGTVSLLSIDSSVKHKH